MVKTKLFCEAVKALCFDKNNCYTLRFQEVYTFQEREPLFISFNWCSNSILFSHFHLFVSSLSISLVYPASMSSRSWLDKIGIPSWKCIFCILKSWRMLLSNLLEYCTLVQFLVKYTCYFTTFQRQIIITITLRLWGILNRHYW